MLAFLRPSLRSHAYCRPAPSCVASTCIEKLQTQERAALKSLPATQSALAKALDTDCEYCLETRKKLFGMFKGAKDSSADGERSGTR